MSDLALIHLSAELLNDFMMIVGLSSNCVGDLILSTDYATVAWPMLGTSPDLIVSLSLNLKDRSM